ncbi:hypothetical protein HanXRQr2_Chr04g0190711 [Helianthus annuus]|uniref:Uncharacterized protein n=1 Tax=Helianthus annuus TaxID=4232 RepID=A0A9K3NUY0_HELAN|nr:hypothetical protein HanXRQr2_Chr04g0190711 [Helianthus annuus]
MGHTTLCKISQTLKPFPPPPPPPPLVNDGSNSSCHHILRSSPFECHLAPF